MAPKSFCGGMLQPPTRPPPPSRRVRRSRTYFSHRSTALCATDFSKPTEDTERRRGVASIAVSRDWTDVTASTFAAASSDAAVAASGATFIKKISFKSASLSRLRAQMAKQFATDRDLTPCDNEGGSFALENRRRRIVLAIISHLTDPLPKK